MTEVHRAEAKRTSSEEQVHFLEEIMSEQRKQLIEKDMSLSSFQQRDIVHEKDSASAIAEVERLSTQHKVYKNHLDGARTAPCFL